jgi:hypothetical protein
MNGEAASPTDRSVHRRDLDAWMNPLVRTGERRIMGPAACDIPGDLGTRAVAGVAEISTDPNAPLKPNRRYMRYTSDENGWDLVDFETDGDGNIILAYD